MNIDLPNTALFIACWGASFAFLWTLWLLGMRDMAFFRLVRETVGESSWIRWPLGVGASYLVGWMAFGTCFPVCHF